MELGDLFSYLTFFVCVLEFFRNLLFTYVFCDATMLIFRNKVVFKMLQISIGLLYMHKIRTRTSTN